MRYSVFGSRRGAVSWVLLLVALVVGAAGLWLLGSRAPTAPEGAESLAEGTDEITTHGEWVYIERGEDSVRAYVAYPEADSPAPAVIVIHEIFGLTDWEPTVADRLAASGYVAIVPDLLSSTHGRSPEDPDEGRKLVGDLSDETVTADLDATYEYVIGLPAVDSSNVGTIGFCWGGGQSFRYATSNPRLNAAVVCYGSSPSEEEMARIEAPVLGVHGEQDERINARLPWTDSAMTRLGKSYEYDIYEGTGHGFLKPGRRGSDGPQVEAAWDRIIAFYRTNLGQ